MQGQRWQSWWSYCMNYNYIKKKKKSLSLNKVRHQTDSLRLHVTLVYLLSALTDTVSHCWQSSAFMSGQYVTRGRTCMRWFDIGQEITCHREKPGGGKKSFVSKNKTRENWTQNPEQWHFMPNVYNGHWIMLCNFQKGRTFLQQLVPRNYSHQKLWSSCRYFEITPRIWISLGAEKYT